ncbi:MAG: PIN domain-containing protein [Archangium sp.]
MLLAPFRVVLDANVLYPFTLRDTLLRAAAEELFLAHWSDEILDEATRNLIDDEVVTAAQAQRLRDTMNAAFPEALVRNYAPLADGLTNDAKDRHVVAAAVKVGAQVIVTMNLRDFEPLPDGIEAQQPDDFLCNLLDLSPETVSALVRRQAADLTRPARTLDEVLQILAKSVPDFVEALREHLR